MIRGCPFNARQVLIDPLDRVLDPKCVKLGLTNQRNEWAVKKGRGPEL
jgi:hypothetical protein